MVTMKFSLVRLLAAAALVVVYLPVAVVVRAQQQREDDLTDDSPPFRQEVMDLFQFGELPDNDVVRHPLVVDSRGTDHADEAANPIGNEARARVNQTIHNFMNLPVLAVAVWKQFYELGGFPNDLEATDRDLALTYMYSLTTVLGEESSKMRPYYALENGLCLGYWGSNHGLFPYLVYREPGESGYDTLTDFDTSSLYFNTCVNNRTGEGETCVMEERAQYISCVNDCAVLVKCNDTLSQRDCSALYGGDDQQAACESNVKWCREYAIEQADSSNTMGFIPNNYVCFNEQGRPSETTGEVWVVNEESGNAELGTCIFEDNTPVNSAISGPYAYCGGNGTDCEPFHGVYETYDYDPRYRPWYTGCRNAQQRRWSDLYFFSDSDFYGMTWTDPIYTMDEQGRSVFHGVLAMDVELADITNFLVESYRDTIFIVGIYEEAEPHCILGVSTGFAISKNVLTTDQSQVCSEEQTEAGECTLICSTIEDLAGESPDDTVLHKVHHAFVDTGFDPKANELVVVWEDEDDINSPAHAGAFILYEHPNANLRWRIVVATELTKNPGDTIEIGDSIFVVLCCLAGFGFTICFTLFALFYKRRFEKAVLFADYRFTSFFILGCALMNLSTLTLLGPNTNELCMLRVWSFNMLTSMTLSPLLIKILRIHRLLGTVASVSNEGQKMSNFRAFLLIWPIPIVQAMILAAFTVLDPPEATSAMLLTPMSQTPVQSVRCQASNTYLIIQVCFTGGLVVCGCYLAYMTRNVDPKFGDAKALLFAMYNIAFTGIMIEAIISVVDISEEGRWTLLCVGVFWVSVFSSAAFVVPRLIEAKKDRRRSKARMKQAREMERRLDSIIAASTSRVSSLKESEEVLRVLVCTANMGNAEPNLASMKAWIPKTGTCNQVTHLDEAMSFGAKKFDLIAIGMQEATWTKKKGKEGDFDFSNHSDGSERDTTETASNSVLGRARKTADELAENKFLASVDGEDTVTVRNMIKDILGPRYTSLVEQQRGQMRLYIFALDEVAPFIENVKCSGANTGIGNVLSNKGGIVISLTYLRTRLTFLSAHLAAHEGESYFQSRCDNVYDILKGSKTFDLTKLSDTALTSHHMFVFGDLNFRTKFERHNTNQHKENVNRALKLVKDKDFGTLYGYDELHKAVRDGCLLVDFQTLPCNFHPTFKVQREDGFVYKEKRTPSYTDRILFKSAEGLGSSLKPIAYEPCVDFITSDHKPIRGAFLILPNEVTAPTILEGRIRMVFKDMECSDLPAGDVEGMSDPYVMIVWDSVDMKEEGKGASRFRRRLMTGYAWPKTSYKSKTLNPTWKDEEISIVTTGDDREIGAEAMLLVTVWDYDFASSDDWLGSVPLNIHELVTMRRTDNGKKEILFDRPLQRHGKHYGRIKFKLEISLLIG